MAHGRVPASAGAEALHVEMLPEESAELNTEATVSDRTFSQDTIVNLYIYETGTSVEGEVYLCLVRFYHEARNREQIAGLNALITRLRVWCGHRGQTASSDEQGHLSELRGLERALVVDLRGRFERGGSSRWDPVLKQVRLAHR